MRYSTSLIERNESDLNGQQLADMISAHLTFLSDEGLDDFMMVPVHSNGTTTGVIIAARGDPPGTAQGEKAFKELTGLDHPRDLLASQE